ncbi:siroheme biosynthesis protein MET8 [Pluteus cervinus]|uniref:Siroheme biosynthesis protein MET8 n=1 Tax=Pluteus cervinus TaxID=181527 RepID=A0ACD3BEY0_9AGAR|nr:siroheme biosynthesis protein MET8 [Pluteus cervinus]
MASTGGGSLLIAWQLKDKTVLIVGGGEIAAQRIDSVLTTDACILLVCPSEGLSTRTAQLVSIHSTRITHFDRLFSGRGELTNVDMVLTALDDNERSRDICELCRERKIPVNAADIPDLCDFYFGAQIRDGPLQVMISTNGNGPKLAALVKDKIKSSFTGKEGEAITKVGRLRSQLKERAPGVGGAVGKKRMRWMSSICEKWSMDDLAMLDEPAMSKLLEEGWEKNRVPSPKEILETSGTTTSMAIAPSHIVISGVVVGAICMALTLVLKRR